jgi:hypothetical protein
VKNGSQAANQMFFAFPVLKLTARFQLSCDVSISEAKKIFEQRRSHFLPVSLQQQGWGRACGCGVNRRGRIKVALKKQKALSRKCLL